MLSDPPYPSFQENVKEDWLVLDLDAVLSIHANASYLKLSR